MIQILLMSKSIVKNEPFAWLGRRFSSSAENLLRFCASLWSSISSQALYLDKEHFRSWWNFSIGTIGQIFTEYAQNFHRWSYWTFLWVLVKLQFQLSFRFQCDAWAGERFTNRSYKVQNQNEEAHIRCSSVQHSIWTSNSTHFYSIFALSVSNFYGTKESSQGFQHLPVVLDLFYTFLLLNYFCPASKLLLIWQYVACAVTLFSCFSARLHPFHSQYSSQPVLCMQVSHFITGSSAENTHLPACYLLYQRWHVLYLLPAIYDFGCKTQCLAVQYRSLLIFNTFRFLSVNFLVFRFCAMVWAWRRSKHQIFFTLLVSQASHVYLTRQYDI